MNALRIGSLCTGYGGLDVAVQAVYGGELAWVADPDPGAAAILAHHHPDVPNLRDITDIDWTGINPVDILCAGFPCQDISYAGRGAGIRKGNRSGLWHVIADALGVLRPRLVVLENVAAIVGRRPGLDVVLADLARLGFDAEWACVRASDIGAPHGRNRWFLVANAQDQRHERRRLAWGRRPGPANSGLSTADAGHGRTRRTGRQRPSEWSSPGGDGLAPAGAHASQWGPYGPAIRRWEHATGRPGPRPTELYVIRRNTRLPVGMRGSLIGYDPRLKGYPKHRLSPRFVEWLMGLPAGHVTDVPGLSRNQQLKALGNGVVPAQAVAALVHLTERRAAA